MEEYLHNDQEQKQQDVYKRQILSWLAKSIVNPSMMG